VALSLPSWAIACSPTLSPFSRDDQLIAFRNATQMALSCDLVESLASDQISSRHYFNFSELQSEESIESDGEATTNKQARYSRRFARACLPTSTIPDRSSRPSERVGLGLFAASPSSSRTSISRSQSRSTGVGPVNSSGHSCHCTIRPSSPAAVRPMAANAPMMPPFVPPNPSSLISNREASSR